LIWIGKGLRAAVNIKRIKNTKRTLKVTLV
jgi:hypothetical protein